MLYFDIWSHVQNIYLLNFQVLQMSGGRASTVTRDIPCCICLIVWNKQSWVPQKSSGWSLLSPAHLRSPSPAGRSFGFIHFCAKQDLPAELRILNPWTCFFLFCRISRLSPLLAFSERNLVAPKPGCFTPGFSL